MDLPPWLMHAFAPPEKTFAANPDEEWVAREVCAGIHRRGMSTVALVYLESFRPLHFVGTQCLHFFTPFLAGMGSPEGFRQFMRLLEKPGSIDYLCRMLETEDFPPDEPPPEPQPAEAEPPLPETGESSEARESEPKS